MMTEPNFSMVKDHVGNCPFSFQVTLQSVLTLTQCRLLTHRLLGESSGCQELLS
jgi:hypothetical protein